MPPPMDGAAGREKAGGGAEVLDDRLEDRPNRPPPEERPPDDRPPRGIFFNCYCYYLISETKRTILFTILVIFHHTPPRQKLTMQTSLLSRFNQIFLIHRIQPQRPPYPCLKLPRIIPLSFC